MKNDEKYKRVEVYFNGKVQGVFFRANVQRKARALGVKGVIKNLTDGRVWGIFEGEEKDLKALIKWACENIPLAKVESVEEKWGHYLDEYKDFEIIY
ncbi:MAG TPA: acylphosphatase [Thermoplasmata archaeon]|nr:acylphosphatase [Thermoplasmata archaeon]